MAERFWFEVDSAQGSILVPVSLKPRLSYIKEMCDFKVDTGATVTTISKTRLKLLGYDELWIKKNSAPMTFVTAGVTVEEAYVRVPYMEFAGKRFFNWPLAICKDNGQDFPLLLGTDILVWYDYGYVSATGHFYFEPCGEPKLTLPLLERQIVGDIDDVLYEDEDFSASKKF